jgi:hypothetical protein
MRVWGAARWLFQSGRSALLPPPLFRPRHDKSVSANHRRMHVLCAAITVISILQAHSRASSAADWCHSCLVVRVLTEPLGSFAER